MSFRKLIAALLLAPSLAWAATPTSLDVSWTAPTTNVDGTPLTDLAGYRLYLSTPCPSQQYATVGNATAVTVSGLTPSTTYTARVTAVDTSGNESGCSPTATGTTLAGGLPPPASNLSLAFSQETPKPMAWAFVSAAASSNKVATKSVTTGNLLVVGFAQGDGTSTPTISDGVNTWTQLSASPVKDVTNAAAVAMWYAVAVSTASITVTITSGATTFNGTWLAEYSNGAGALSGALEDNSKGAANVAGSTGTNAMTTGTMVTSTDGCLIVGFINDDQSDDHGVAEYTAGTSTITYTKRATASVDPNSLGNTTYATEDGVQTSAGSIEAAWTSAVADHAVMIQAAFKAPTASDTLMGMMWQ